MYRSAADCLEMLERHNWDHSNLSQWQAKRIMMRDETATTLHTVQVDWQMTQTVE